jgi:UDP-N-acetylglucosamine 1-carboxyvinyltransferase
MQVRNIINFEIAGGKKLHGTVETNTAKNSAVGLLCASLLNEAETLLIDMPKIEEVFRIIEVLHSIGASAVWEGQNLRIRPPKKLAVTKMDVDTAMRTRSAIMLIGPLLHLFPKFHIPQAGGCQLGSRTVEPHFFALENLGVHIKTLPKSYEITRKSLKRNRTVILYEAGDTVTENILMAAAKVPGKTTIKFASANYQVQDLCRFLELLGAKVEGIGTTTMVIRGNPHMAKPVEFRPSEDPIESMLFLSIAATTGSELLIKRCPIDFLELELLKLKKMGFRYKIVREYVSKNGFTRLADVRTYPSKLTALHDKLSSGPFPDLNIDNLPFFVPIAIRSSGTTLIHDWVYENRAIYYLELKKLGANILLADPHRVYVEGPSHLKGAEVICPPPLRPAAIILIAMLAAEGKSTLRNVYSINRGYEDLAARLKKLGADIKVLKLKA